MTKKTTATVTPTPVVTISDVLARRLAREESESQEKKLYASTMRALGESDDLDSDEIQAAKDLAKLHGFDFEADLFFLRQRRAFLEECDNDPEQASNNLFAERQKAAEESDALVADFHRRKRELEEKLMTLNTKAMLIIQRSASFAEETSQRNHLFTNMKG